MGTTNQAVQGYALGCNVRLTHQTINKVVCVASRNPIRFLGILSLVV